MHFRWTKSAWTSILILAIAAAVLATPAGARQRDDDGNFHHAIYLETNAPTGNTVVVFDRHKDGTITQGQVVATGGLGAPATPPFGFPLTDSQGAVTQNDSGSLIFAVNAGDNTISSFRATPSGLVLADRASSGGTLPVSVTTHGNLLYVLNEVSGSIFGFHFNGSGRLQPIGGSWRSLATPGPDGVAAQIGLSPDGRVVSVTNRCFMGCPLNPLGLIDTYVLGPGDVAVSHTWTPSAAPLPFGFAYAGPHHLIVTNVGFASTRSGMPPPAGDPTQLNGSTSSYDIGHDGTLNVTSDVASGGRATCWITITQDGKYAFVTNSLSTFPPGTGHGAITRYSIAHDGTLTKLGQTDTTPDFPTDLDLSKDGKYLYVLNDTLNPFDNTSHIDVYRVDRGNLTHIQTTPSNLPGGTSGLIAG
jgi:6-phosphogluconolactonase (cycloisomerase 2 family)